MREGARMLRALAQKLQCAPKRLAVLGKNLEILELQQILEVFLRPCSLAFVVHADERARGDLVLSNIEVVSATGFGEDERRVSLVEMKDLHVGNTESLRLDDSEERTLTGTNRADDQVVTHIADVWMISKRRAPARGG